MSAPSNQPQAKRTRGSHVTSHHGGAPARVDHHRKPQARTHVAMLMSLDALGWRVTEIRPTGDRDAPLWHVKIDRVDFVASMTATAPDPDVALEELVRYATADADEPR